MALFKFVYFNVLCLKSNFCKVPSTINSVIDLQSSLDVPKHEYEQNKRFMTRATFHDKKLKVISHLFIRLIIHSQSKCLVWVKKCFHVWLDQNFLKKKIQNGRLKKTIFFKIANSQYFFVKISWIGPWVSRIDWCEGHWCSSTYMVERLFNVISKTGKNYIFCVLGWFWAYLV